MKLDRNIASNAGCGKYAILKLRRLYNASAKLPMEVTAAIQCLDDHGLIEWGQTGTEGEFFLIKLKDRHAQDALVAYGNSIYDVDQEFGREVLELARRAGPSNPFCKEPD